MTQLFWVLSLRGLPVPTPPLGDPAKRGCRQGDRQLLFTDTDGRAAAKRRQREALPRSRRTTWGIQEREKKSVRENMVGSRCPLSFFLIEAVSPVPQVFFQTHQQRQRRRNQQRFHQHSLPGRQRRAPVKGMQQFCPLTSQMKGWERSGGFTIIFCADVAPLICV